MWNPQSQNGYAYVENNPINFIDPSGFFKQRNASDLNQLINTGKSSGYGYSWALDELHQSVHYYGYFDKNQSDYLFGLSVANDGNAEWAKAQLLNNVVDITIDDLYYLYVLGDMTVTQNDKDIEMAIKRKLYAPVFDHGLEIFTSGLFLGFTAVEFALVSAPVAARVEQTIEKDLQTTGRVARVGQWMSKEEYEGFNNTGIIPRTNVLTNGKEGYIKQANNGDFYVEFDVDSSLLVEKNTELGWSLVKSKNDMYLKLAEKKGIPLPAPIGTNIQHVDTK